ncbi:MAG TPA: VOC family protein [Pseudomonadales bacterium]|nr:VOC family protein [Pseudomonadales bacterium]
MTSGGIHHVAYACRDLEATRHFYEDLLGFPLVHTEVQGRPDRFMRHIFFDLGDGSSLAFFYLNGVGEPEDYRTDISTGMNLPIWVNHVAFRADESRVADVRSRLTGAGIEPTMEQDHGWCHSVYYTDPNGILVEFCRDTPGFEPNPDSARQLLTAVPGK